MSAVLKEVLMTETAAIDALPEVPPGLREDGVDALVYLLRYPEKIHVYNLSALHATSREAVDWQSLPETFRRMFEQHESRCVDAYMRVRLALAVLSSNSVQLCRGPAGVRLWQDECCFQYVTVTIWADVDGYRAYCLIKELMHLVIDSNIRSAGFGVDICSIHPWNPADWPPRAVSTFDDEDEDEDEDDGE